MPPAKKKTSASSARGAVAGKAAVKAKPVATKKPPLTAPAKKTPSAAAIEAADLAGRPAPDFTLPNQDGAPVSLASLTARGNLVLYFYPKDMTPGCTVEACGFRDAVDEIHALGAEIVGVSADPPAAHRKFIEKHGLNFPLLSDPDNRVTSAYGVYKKKSLYGREFMGIQRTTFIIRRDGVVRTVFPKVKVSGHTGEVLAALKSSA